MTPDYLASPTPRKAAESAAHHLLGRLRVALDRKGWAAIAFSGGSTPRLMFEHLAGLDFDWTGVHIFWVDERCVPQDHAESNYRMTRQALLEPLRFPGEQVHRIEGELSPEQAADRYVSTLHEFFELREDDLPRFDIIHLGMGADAHTASLFPGESLILDRKHVAAAVYSAARDSYRVTLLPGVLLHAAEIFFLVTGKDKSETLLSLFMETFDPLALPAQLMAHEGSNVRWFLDEAAAEGLRRV